MLGLSQCSVSVEQDPAVRLDLSSGLIASILLFGGQLRPGLLSNAAATAKSQDMSGPFRLPRARAILFSCVCRVNPIRCIFGSEARFFSS